MTEIEKMKQYIKRTNISDKKHYEMNFLEIHALTGMNCVGDALCLAFLYSRAKGYRAAKAEVRKQK